MPYKNIEDRREAHRRWRLSHPDYWKRNKERKATDDEKMKNRVRMRSKRLFEDRQGCSVNDCSELGERHHPHYPMINIVWLCREHHIAIHQGQREVGCNL